MKNLFKHNFFSIILIVLFWYYSYKKKQQYIEREVKVLTIIPYYMGQSQYVFIKDYFLLSAENYNINKKTVLQHTKMSNREGKKIS